MELKKISVVKWLNNKDKITYDFKLFEDDNIEDGITKIALGIIDKDKDKSKNDRFYVWNENQKSILFEVTNFKWKGYNYNPLKATDLTNPNINQPIIYKFNNGLCYFNNINIIFESDFPELKNNPYYFIDRKTKVKLEQLKNREAKLIELSKKDSSNVTSIYYNIHRYELYSKLNKERTFAELFDKLNTNPLISYIQWVNDAYTILHKLHLNHNISPSILKNWTSTEKISNINCIHCYSLLADTSNSYVKITINADMTILVNFIIDLRRNITWNDIEMKLKKIQSYLEMSLLEKITFKPISLKVYITMTVNNTSIQKVAKNISEYIDIFKTINIKNYINLIYKRSSNFSNEQFDYNSYVKNRLLLGVEHVEIINELLSFELSREEARKIIETELSLITELEQQNIKENPIDKQSNTIVIVKSTKKGYDIDVYNIPNKKEFDNLIFWLSKVIGISIDKSEARKKAILKKSTSSSPTSSPIEDEEEQKEDLGKLVFSSSVSNTPTSSSGGALGKAKHSYFVNLLQQADKDLFGDNYARDKCQAVKQPVVFTEKERQKLIDEGRYHVDNDLYYGSKKDNMNYYACPRLWCPDSKVPADINTRKCPIEDEEPMQQFFENDPNKKRYVKLIKPNDNGICVPCCFKTPPKEEELNKCKNYKTYDPNYLDKIRVEEKDENYLVNYPAPVALGRYGVIPIQIYDLLFPDIKYANCAKDLSKNENCLVRKGIVHKELNKNDNQPDSLIFALSYLLNFKNKKEFINDIKSKLDLFTFLSIENGNVCKAFMEPLPIIPSDNLKLINELKEHFRKFPTLKQLYDIDYNNTYKLSRILSVFKSYNKFIEYLSANDNRNNKSPYFLFNLISVLYNKLLIVFEKEKDNSVSILTPYYNSFNDLIGSMEINPSIIMLLKEKRYFEPIELKSKNKEGIKTLPLSTFPELQEIINKTEINTDVNVYKDIYSLNTWLKSKILRNNVKYLINTIIINEDLTIEHLLTKGNILINIKKIGLSYLSRFIKDLEIEHIYFYDDIIENKIEFNINVNLDDLEKFKQKLISLNMKYDIGELNPKIKQKEPVSEVYTILKFPKKPLTNMNSIHSRLEDDLYLYEKENTEENKKWFQLQIMIFKILSSILDNKKLQELQKLKRKDYIQELLKLLKNANINKKEFDYNKIPNSIKNKIKVIIEELPIYSIEHIKKYLNNIIMYYKYDFLNPNIKIINNEQYLFSQVALNKGIPERLFNYHLSNPTNNFKEIIRDYNYNKNEVKIQEDVSKLPRLLKDGTYQSLNSKWIMHKKSKWTNMKTLFIQDYKQEDFIQFFNWFANVLQIKTDFNIIIESANNKLRLLRNDETEIKKLLKDNVLFSVFSKVSGKKYTNVNVFWEKEYANLGNSQRIEFINKVIQTGFPINDLHLLAISENLNINIIIIHRAIYGTTEVEVVRGDIEDLILSSTFFKAPNNYINRPFLIFNKILNEKKEVSYQLIVDNTLPLNSKVLYMKMEEIPLAIQYLINEHLK